MLNKTLVLLTLMMTALSLFSQDTVEVKPTWVFSGFADAYYNLSFEGPGVGPKLWGPAAGSRAFDVNNNQFSLGMVQGKFTYSKKKLDFVADVIAGPNSAISTVAAFKNLSYPTSFGGGTFGIKQLYGVYKPNDKVSITIGQFGTHIGYEVIEPYINFNYSLSNLFNNGPFFHTGVKFNYAVSDKFGFMVGLVNTWDNFDDNNKFKDPIFQLSFVPTKGMNIYLNYITGKGDQAGSAHPVFATLSDPNSFTTGLLDLTAAYVVGKATIGLNAAAGSYSGSTTDTKTKFKALTKGKADNPSWSGIAGYFNIAASDEFAIGARYEIFHDYYGVRYIGANNNSFTLTGSFNLAGGSFILKPELRFDSSTGDNNVNGHTDIYFGKDGKTKASQSTIGMSAIFKF